MLIANVALALAPSLLLLWWAYRRESGDPQSLRLLTMAFLLGLLAVIPALAVGMLASLAHRLLSGSLRLLYQAFVTAAAVEEGVKFALVWFLVRRNPRIDGVADGIVYGMAASLGFAFLESVLYVGESSFILLLRGVTAVPLHAGCGALMGYFVARSRSRTNRRAWVGLLLAILVHGTYDSFVFAGGSVAFLSLAVVAALVAAVPLLLLHAGSPAGRP